MGDTIMHLCPQNRERYNRFLARRFRARDTKLIFEQGDTMTDF